ADPELIAAGLRSHATMTAHLKAMAAVGAPIGDPELAGHMFWSALHGAIQLQAAGLLDAPFDAERLAAATMATLWAGLLASNAAAPAGASPLTAPASV
ncbi:MAG TPA: TetR-like C-terminal domain-containing protein, partial [Caulobacteraceae bacterium]|nr:TetR-like C-terminal domain-containing protein [Caulobacteraceae bacterium]